MKAAVVYKKGEAPIYSNFSEPSPESNQYKIHVQASSISQITKARASTIHYSSDNEVPFIPGFDGVGNLEDGSRVYFLLPKNPYGAMAEYCIVDKENCLVLPQILSAESIAAMAIPGMSSWAALVDQAKMVKGDTVLINGAGGISGRLAIQVAKFLQAKKIIATVRRKDQFDELYALGADLCIQLTDDAVEMEKSFCETIKQGINVVLDYLWGGSALSLIQCAAKYSPQGLGIEFVQIGSIGGATIPFPASALRSSGLRVIGSGLGSLSVPQMLNAISQFINYVSEANFSINTQVNPLSEVTAIWNTTSSNRRIVLKI